MVVVSLGSSARSEGLSGWRRAWLPGCWSSGAPWRTARITGGLVRGSALARLNWGGPCSMQPQQHPVGRRNLPRSSRHFACSAQVAGRRQPAPAGFHVMWHAASFQPRAEAMMSRTVRAADGIWWMRTLLVNVVFVGSRDRWVLVDAGVGGYGGAIAAAARELFGHRPPEAIILTHGHFDHVGSLEPLVERWGAPVFAHPMELPYLTGRSSYP